MTAKTNEILESHEIYFRPVNIEADDINCGDERGTGLYIHIFGGALFVPFNLMIMQEAAAPGSGGQSFEATVRRLVPMLSSKGISGQGVHSDEHAEHGSKFRGDSQGGPVGCGYGGLRRDISRLIQDKSDLIIGKAIELRPELFATDDDLRYARRAAEAHGRLAGGSLISSGRDVVRAAIGEGAGVKVLAGSHVATQGIINTVKGSSLDSGKALADGLPIYDHDLWASNELFARLNDTYPFSPKHIEIASTLDIIGTLEALDAHNIAVR